MDSMLFHKQLFVDKALSKKKRKVLKNLKQGKLQLGVYIITISNDRAGMLDIYPSYVLLQKMYKELELYVVGIAAGKDGAFELVKEITDKCLEETGNVDLRTFLQE